MATHKNEIVIKWQLFTEIGDLLPLDHNVFEWAYQYAEMHDFKTTASVFDNESLDYLLHFKVPFIKLACRDYLFKYLRKIERHDVTAIISIREPQQKAIVGQARYLCCVPEYPAKAKMYESIFGGSLSVGISDHTSDFMLYKKYEPLFYESHFKLPDSEGADNGPWSKTPEQWR